MMSLHCLRRVCATLLVLGLSASPLMAEPRWTATGWGGGGFYYSAAFHPTRDGVIYLGGDVNGLYKSVDEGKSWRIINNGIAGYGVFAIATDPSSPDTLWAATDEGLSKSTDAGETWKTIPQSGRKDLRLTGEKNRSIHNVAVDPSSSNTVYVGTPHGKIYKTTDGGANWALAYERSVAAEAVPSLRLQFGGVNNAIFGGFWRTLQFPESVTAGEVTGIGFSVRNEGAHPRDIFFTLRTSTGLAYRSRNLHEQLAPGDWRDIVLTAADFTLDPELKSKQPEKAAGAPATPDWATVNRFDFACVAGFDQKPAVFHLGRVFVTQGADKVTASDLAEAKQVQVFGNLKVGDAIAGPILSVAVSPEASNIIAAASSDQGLLLSTDAGKTWQVRGPMKSASAVAFAASAPQTLYAACGKEQVWKSIDLGTNWTKISAGMEEAIDIRDVVVNPANADQVFALGTQSWGGRFFASNDGGMTWTAAASMKPDAKANPTLPAETATGSVPLSAARNLAINPRKPSQLFIAANWRSAISHDAGRTWTESAQGADISCVTDIRFHKDKVYVSNMDEGVLSSDDNGASWKQLWPLRHSQGLSGHYWRLDVRNVNGAVRIVSTSSPWDAKYNQVVVSDDSGNSFKPFRKGLPDYIPTANTAWGRSYARALAVDPTDPNVIYLGLDGDPTPGQMGGGVFKSTDGGQTWAQLANQPGSRRMFFGLAVDPTNPKRVYWSACGTDGGLYRSDDAGGSWQHVFRKEQWVFNLHVTSDGTLYALGKNIHRSTDQGKTWTTLPALPGGGTVVGFEVHPTDPKILWATANYWNSDGQVGGVYKSIDGGKTWTDLTGDLPYRRPLVLRYNPATQELWAGGVGLYRIKQ